MPRVTSQILLNEWQWQKENDYQRWLKDQAYQHQLKEERYERKQAELHCLKLPTRHDCPECSNQYWEFRQSQTNHRSIHAQDAYHHNNMDRRLKIEMFIIGWEKELLVKTGWIMKKKVMKKNMFGRKANGVQEV